MPFLNEIHALSAAPGFRSVTITSDFTFSRHSHDEFGLGLITDGAHRSASGRGQVEATRGELITVSPGEIHDGAPIGPSHRSWTMLYVEPSVIASACIDEDRFGTNDGEIEFIAPVIADSTVRCSYKNFHAVLRRQSSLDPLELEEAISGLFVPILRLRSQRDRPTSVGAARAIERVCDDPASAPTLTELAEIAEVSRFQLIRAVERITGFTPFALLRQARLDRARRLILAGHPIAEAAAEAGFSDQSHLTRTFRAAYGLTPGMLRASID